ncbi:MAG TPA: hypothetical protein VGI41_07410 [Candidatus Udaeobacter sp.]|jgi:hypothetical protein
MSRVSRQNLGSSGPPYLRIHDPAQQALVALGEHDLKAGGGRAGLRPYLDRMIHFWREISLADFPCAGKAIDECYALLFESTFSLARLEPAWGIACLNKAAGEVHIDALQHFANQVRTATIAHSDLINALTHLYAPQREQTATWQNPVNVALAGELWFWAAIHLVVGLQENDWLWAFH